MSQAADVPVSLTSTPMAPPRRRRAAIILFALASLLWLIVAFEMFFHVPRLAKLFGEFHMALPRASELVVRHYWWFVPVYTVLTALTCIGLAFIRRPSRFGWIFLLIILPLLLNTITLAVLWIPFAKLVEGLRGRPAGILEFLQGVIS
jgi:hypothetical protein